MSAPDWRQAKHYADLPDMSLAELAWEFLRRNPQYCQDFETWREHRLDDPETWAKWGLLGPADPELSAARQPVFWRPEAYPRTIVLVEAPDASAQTLVYNPQAWRGAYHERRAADGVHGLLVTPLRQYHLWSPVPISRGAPFVCLVPMGADAANGVAAILQFWRHLNNARPERARRSDPKRQRACRSLQALDGHAAGESYRALAVHFFGAARVATESWRTSSLRDATIRMVRKGLGLANGDYRRLLRQIVE
ncbi:MAG: hypothetical protein CFE28_10815 [Alphaproteobacteria bacterium PA2]|nr:MAG: hypothetical protein CFE28_10815 [Alphaproteobacteria bacterium PA2]